MRNTQQNLGTHNKRNTLGMNGQVYKQLLSKLELMNGSSTEPVVNRIYTRLEYLDPFLEIVMETSDRMQRTITVASRNISRGGMSFLHSSFVYPGTTIIAKLFRADSSLFNAKGKVIRCSHRGGVVHEIGIKFDTEIVVQEFIQPDINDSIKTLESVKAEQLKGKILIVGEDPSLIPFIREYLQPSSLNYGFVNTAKDANEKTLSEYNLIFACLDCGTMSGPEFAKNLRNSGYKKPIILAGRADDELTKKQIKLSAADMFLPIPITENSLLCALGEFLVSEWSEKTLETVRSGIDLDTVVTLRNELARLGIVLDQHIRTDDPVQAYAACTKIRSIAPLLGMKTLRDLSLTIGEEIASSGDLTKLVEGLDDIKLICSSMIAA